MAIKRIIIVTGPTAVGKTAYALELAKKYNSPIISADSRQIYNELNIGTAKPSKLELEAVKHYFVNHISITQSYDVGQYGEEVSVCLEELFRVYDTLIVCGGTGLYIYSITKGLDKFPPVSIEVKNFVRNLFEVEGLISLQKLLLDKDPDYYYSTDILNPRRIMRALEICLSSGQTFSSFIGKSRKVNDYKIEKVCLEMERSKLYQRINERVDHMLESGLIEEARLLTNFRDHQALNTVGYKEVFKYLDNEYQYEEMKEKIKQHTRNYAKRQITWLKKYFLPL